MLRRRRLVGRLLGCCIAVSINGDGRTADEAPLESLVLFGSFGSAFGASLGARLFLLRRRLLFLCLGRLLGVFALRVRPGVFAFGASLVSFGSGFGFVSFVFLVFFASFAASLLSRLRGRRDFELLVVVILVLFVLASESRRRSRLRGELVDVGLEVFEGDLLRASEAGLGRVGVGKRFFVLLEELLQLFVGGSSTLLDVVGHGQRNRFDDRHAVHAVEPIPSLARSRNRLAAIRTLGMNVSVKLPRQQLLSHQIEELVIRHRRRALEGRLNVVELDAVCRSIARETR